MYLFLYVIAVIFLNVKDLFSAILEMANVSRVLLFIPSQWP